MGSAVYLEGALSPGPLFARPVEEDAFNLGGSDAMGGDMAFRPFVPPDRGDPHRTSVLRAYDDSRAVAQVGQLFGRFFAVKL